MRPPSTTSWPSTNTVCTPRPSADQTSWFITFSSGRHSGRSVSCSTTSAFLPGSSEPISVLHQHRAGTPEGGHLVGLLRREHLRVRAGVLEQPGHEVRRPVEIAVVGSVVAVRADRHVDPGLHHLGHLAHLGDAVADLERRRRAVGHRHPGLRHDRQLVVVDVHAVGDRHVGAQHTELGEVDHRPMPELGDEPSGSSQRRRHVEAHARAVLVGERARRLPQRVANRSCGRRGSTRRPIRPPATD